MARDERDFGTVELPGLPAPPARRRPGRPRKPDALTPTERARRYRERHAGELVVRRSRVAQREILGEWLVGSEAEPLAHLVGGLELALALGILPALEVERLLSARILSDDLAAAGLLLV